MLWLSEQNWIRVFRAQVNDKGFVNASGSVREKDKDGNVSYKNFNLRFSRAASERAKDLADSTVIKVTRGGVDVYPSTKYKTDKGVPLMIPFVQINDFEVATFNNGDTETLSQAMTRKAKEEKATAPTPPAATDDDDPFATV